MTKTTKAFNYLDTFPVERGNFQYKLVLYFLFEEKIGVKGKFLLPRFFTRISKNSGTYKITELHSFFDNSKLYKLILKQYSYSALHAHAINISKAKIYIIAGGIGHTSSEQLHLFENLSVPQIMEKINIGNNQVI
jgi:hypothetical protein